MQRGDLAAPVPFEIAVPDEDLADLTERIGRTRWPDQVEGVDWAQGTEKDFLRGLVEQWATDYDWRAHEKELNGYAQYLADVDGFRIHFVHERGRGPNPVPLLLGHSCFSNFYEFHDVVRRLTDPESFGGRAEDSFDVVVWSLPGFG